MNKQRVIDLDTSSVIELKAAAWDLRRALGAQQAQLQQLEAAIVQREAASPVDDSEVVASDRQDGATHELARS